MTEHQDRTEVMDMNITADKTVRKKEIRKKLVLAAGTLTVMLAASAMTACGKKAPSETAQYITAIPGDNENSNTSDSQDRTENNGISEAAKPSDGISGGVKPSGTAPTSEASAGLTTKLTGTPTPGLTKKPTETPVPVLTKKPTETPTPIPTKTPTAVPAKPTEAPVPTKPLSYYEEAFAGDCFIGDSRTDELFTQTGISTADFLCKTGLNVKAAINESSIMSALENNQYRNIYIEFGVNELGWQSLDYFENYYVELINKIQELQPDAKIYVQSIIPVSQNKSDSSSTETLANVDKFNKRVINAASRASVTYLDVTVGICGESRVLPYEASSDGVHPNKKYNLKWLDYIINNR